MDVLTKKITYREFAEMDFPDDDPYIYELINGELVKKSAPSPRHQRIQRKLLTQLSEFISKNKLGEVFGAPIDVFLDEHSVPQPDLVFVNTENRPIVDDDEGILGVPQLVIEIVSPSSFKRDNFEKKELYEKHGISEYWIVHPDYKSIEIYNLVDGKFELTQVAENGEKIQSKVIEGFEMEVESLFTTP